MICTLRTEFRNGFLLLSSQPFSAFSICLFNRRWRVTEWTMFICDGEHFAAMGTFYGLHTGLLFYSPGNGQEFHKCMVFYCFNRTEIRHTSIIPASQNHVNKNREKSKNFCHRKPKENEEKEVFLTQTYFSVSIGQSKVKYAVSLKERSIE